MSKSYHTYIMTNKKYGILYTGSTSDLAGRVYKHKNKLIAGFTKKYNITMLVYIEETNSAESAVARERQLKHWKRGWKVNLINKSNPEWKDLSVEW